MRFLNETKEKTKKKTTSSQRNHWRSFNIEPVYGFNIITIKVRHLYTTLFFTVPFCCESIYTVYIACIFTGAYNYFNYKCLLIPLLFISIYCWRRGLVNKYVSTAYVSFHIKLMKTSCMSDLNHILALAVTFLSSDRYLTFCFNCCLWICMIYLYSHSDSDIYSLYL